MTLERIMAFLREYPRPVKIMEVCGTHTSSIVKNGIRGLLSPSIRLVSGPGCPVCVTTASYIDKLAALSLQKDTCVLCYGDLYAVPGNVTSLSQSKSMGGSLRMIYSPLEVLVLAKENPHLLYIVAAVGFETTTPVYAVLLEELVRQGIRNVRLHTALKTMPAALDYLCGQESVDGFLCPGHVSSVIGSEAYEPLCLRYRKPFVIAGFSPEQILAAICRILLQLDREETAVENLYRGAVTSKGNLEAQGLISRYFVPVDGFWRGIGFIKQSALALKPEYAAFGYDSGNIAEDSPASGGCRCGDVMLGRINPDECGLFGAVCRPENPVGACMVSGEGACGIWYTARLSL